MKVHYGFDNIGYIKNPVVTTGSFDGVHLGHSVIINRLKQIARNIQGESVLITFYPHPRKVLFPQSEGKDLLMINTQKEKISLLSQTGLDHLIIVNFTLEFSKTTSVDFIRKYLVDKLHCKYVIVGFNHHFGHNREGNYEYLYELGKYFQFDVEEIPEQDVQNETVSSTKIRKALVEGNIQRANAYLNHLYFMTGKVTHITDTQFDFTQPIFKLEADETDKLIPPPGIYAVNIIHEKTYTKTVGIIPSHQESKFPHILLHPIDNIAITDNSEITVTFHKKITHFPTPIEKGKTQETFHWAKSEIEELIF